MSGLLPESSRIIVDASWASATSNNVGELDSLEHFLQMCARTSCVRLTSAYRVEQRASWEKCGDIAFELPVWIDASRLRGPDNSMEDVLRRGFRIPNGGLRMNFGTVNLPPAAAPGDPPQKVTFLLCRVNVGVPRVHEGNGPSEASRSSVDLKSIIWTAADTPGVVGGRTLPRYFPEPLCVEFFVFAREQVSVAYLVEAAVIASKPVPTTAAPALTPAAALREAVELPQNSSSTPSWQRRSKRNGASNGGTPASGACEASPELFLYPKCAGKDGYCRKTATIFCLADEAALCASCDEQHHAKSALGRRHNRVPWEARSWALPQPCPRHWPAPLRAICMHCAVGVCDRCEPMHARHEASPACVVRLTEPAQLAVVAASAAGVAPWRFSEKRQRAAEALATLATQKDAVTATATAASAALSEKISIVTRDLEGRVRAELNAARAAQSAAQRATAAARMEHEFLSYLMHALPEADFLNAWLRSKRVAARMRRPASVEPAAATAQPHRRTIASSLVVREEPLPPLQV